VTAPISAKVIAKLRALRKIQKVSAQQLSDRMTDLGYPVARTVIANLENGRRVEISIDHVVVAAEALGTTVLALLNDPVVCPQCKSEPPAGFTCNTCGQTGGAA
jgi:transcriptional regulator with XRE-family HTH domain